LKINEKWLNQGGEHLNIYTTSPILSHPYIIIHILVAPPSILPIALFFLFYFFLCWLLINSWESLSRAWIWWHGLPNNSLWIFWCHHSSLTHLNPNNDECLTFSYPFPLPLWNLFSVYKHHWGNKGFESSKILLLKVHTEKKNYTELIMA
jgi:hypothetical protein